MNATKKMIACLLIVCMFLRLPKAEAVADDAVDGFVATTIGFDHQLKENSEQPDCSGIYTILSPCSKKKLSIPRTGGVDSTDLYEAPPADYQSLMDDENDILPWNDVSEPPQTGVLIPILHF